MAHIPVQRNPKISQKLSKIVFEGYIDDLISDIYHMTRQPMPELGLMAGFNVSSSIVMLSLIGGISRVLFDPKRIMQPGQAFKKCLEMWFPWEDEPGKSISKAKAAEILWKNLRNPLEHKLGISNDKKGVAQQIIIISIPNLTDEKIHEIETLDKSPLPFPAVDKGNKGEFLMFTGGLYWGIRRMITKMTYDESLMRAASEMLPKFKIYR